MTTAHRATYAPAQGGYGKNEGDLSRISKQYSARDLPSHTKLKYRQQGQSSADDVKSRDFRGELTVRERTTGTNKRRATSESTGHSPVLEKQRIDYSYETSEVPAAISDESEMDEDDEDDDEAELLAELARIKAEREAEREEQELRRQEQEEQIRTEKILTGNPLLQSQQKRDFKVQRRWDDDVVFKNCAKGLSDRKGESHFINDSIRSEFHRKFMEKYIK